MTNYRPGDRVRLVVLPGWVAKLPQESQWVFRQCVGKVFTIEEMTKEGLLVLDVSGEVDLQLGTFGNDIRVEPEFVEPVSLSDQEPRNLAEVFGAKTT